MINQIKSIILLQITDDKYNVIKRSDLHKFIITEYFNDVYYKNIDFVKQVLKIFFMHPTKEQDNNVEFVYVKYR